MCFFYVFIATIFAYYNKYQKREEKRRKKVPKEKEERALFIPDPTHVRLT